MLLDPGTGAVTTFLEGPDKERFKGVNDLIFARNGDLYFTDQGQTGLHDRSGRVCRLTAGGQLGVLVDTVPSPNGIALNRSEKVVFVAATRSCYGRQRKCHEGRPIREAAEPGAGRDGGRRLEQCRGRPSRHRHRLAI
jgi:sugar lactone lactonase YvrE